MAWTAGMLQWAVDHPTGLALTAVAASIAVATFQPLQQWRLRKIPTIRGTPVIGHLPQVASEDITYFLHRLCMKFSKYKVCRYWMGPWSFVIVSDPDTARKLLNRYTARFRLDIFSFKTGLDHKIWSNLLLTLTGAKWRLGRRATEASLMHPKALLAQVPAVSKCTARLVDSLDRYASTGEPLDIQVCTFAVAMDAVGWAAFGVDLHATTAAGSNHQPTTTTTGADAVAQLKVVGSASRDGQKPLKKPSTGGAVGSDEKWWLEYPVGTPEFGGQLVRCAITCMRAFEITSATIYTPLNLMLPRLYPLWAALSYILPDSRLTREKQAMRGLTGACKVMMDAWKQQQLDKQAGGEKAASEATVSDQGFLARLLSGKDFAHDDTLEDYEVMALAITNIIGGYDTTGTSMAMSLYLLAHNPEAQAKAQQEVDEVLKGKDPQLDDLDQLPWIHAVFQESMRLASPVSGAIRELTDAPFDVGNGIVYSFHNNPDIWPRVDEFLPERFIQPGNEHLAPTIANAFMPFGSGPRMCVGYKFATLETRMALARLMQRFTFIPAPGAPPPKARTGLTLSPDKVMVCVKRRGDKA